MKLFVLNENDVRKQKTLLFCSPYSTYSYFISVHRDATHLLVKKKARDEIERKVEAWMDEVSLVDSWWNVWYLSSKVSDLPFLFFLLDQNVFSAVERVGEDLDMS